MPAGRWILHAQAPRVPGGVWERARMKGAQQTQKEEEAYGEIGQGSFTTNSRERRRATNHVGRGADVGECSTIARGRSWAKGLCQLEINLGARKSGRRRAGGLSKGAGRHGRIPSSRTNNMHHTMHTSFACPDACSMTLAAFTSRWVTPWRCMWRKAATTSAAYARAVPSGNPLPSRLPTTSTQHGQAQLNKCSQKCEVCAFAGVRVGGLGNPIAGMPTLPRACTCSVTCCGARTSDVRPSHRPPAARTGDKR